MLAAFAQMSHLVAHVEVYDILGVIHSQFRVCMTDFIAYRLTCLRLPSLKEAISTQRNHARRHFLKLQSSQYQNFSSQLLTPLNLVFYLKSFLEAKFRNCKRDVVNLATLLLSKKLG